MHRMLTRLAMLATFATAVLPAAAQSAGIQGAWKLTETTLGGHVNTSPQPSLYLFHREAFQHDRGERQTNPVRALRSILQKPAPPNSWPCGVGSGRFLERTKSRARHSRPTSRSQRTRGTWQLV